ncbi:MAG: carboxypeptidase-like regulatory domain-containing protein [Saprospiraceae bacterium]|nr:carboxypeptidase-like regulatory domain-containing protein [Saprospiraceae bacterium]
MNLNISKNLIFRYVFFVIAALSATNLHAQVIDTSIIQFSGLIVTEERKNLVPVPYTTIVVRGTSRATYASADGFFTIVAKKGEVLDFSCVGFKDASYRIPDTIRSQFYTMYQYMTRDVINLPVTVIYALPSKHYFKDDFLAMEVHNELQSIAERNLSAENMERVNKGLKTDGGEASNLTMRQKTDSYYYYGQQKPQQIFNIFAWKDFFQAWKEGKFKKKKSQ